MSQREIELAIETVRLAIDVAERPLTRDEYLRFLKEVRADIRDRIDAMRGVRRGE